MRGAHTLGCTGACGVYLWCLLLVAVIHLEKKSHHAQASSSLCIHAALIAIVQLHSSGPLAPWEPRRKSILSWGGVCRYQARCSSWHHGLWSCIRVGKGSMIKDRYRAHLMLKTSHPFICKCNTELSLPYLPTPSYHTTCITKIPTAELKSPYLWALDEYSLAFCLLLLPGIFFMDMYRNILHKDGAIKMPSVKKPR